MSPSASSKTLWLYFKAAFVEVHKNRPASFYMLLATPLVLLLGYGLFRQVENPYRLALGMALLFVFLGIVLLRAVMDIFEIMRRKLRGHRETFQETLGEDDFISELGRRVQEESDKAPEPPEES